MLCGILHSKVIRPCLSQHPPLCLALQQFVAGGISRSADCSRRPTYRILLVRVLLPASLAEAVPSSRCRCWWPRRFWTPLQCNRGEHTGQAHAPAVQCRLAFEELCCSLIAFLDGKESQRRVDDYSMIGSALGAVLTSFLFWNRAGIPSRKSLAPPEETRAYIGPHTQSYLAVPDWEVLAVCSLMCSRVGQRATK